jgi:hypothetical protein
MPKWNLAILIFVAVLCFFMAGWLWGRKGSSARAGGESSSSVSVAELQERARVAAEKARLAYSESQ